MKIESKSLGVLKVLLAICWWGALAATGLVATLAVVAVIEPGGVLDVDLVGVAGAVDASSLSAVTREGLEARVEFQDPVRLKVVMPAEFWESRRGLVAVGGIVLVGFLALFLAFLKMLRQIVWSVEEGNPFVAENARRLRVMGVLIISGGIGKTVSEFALSGYADAVLKPVGFNLNGHIGLDFTTLILGLSVMVLSEVFRLGTAMREEQDLTV